MQDVCVDEVPEKKQGNSLNIVKIHIVIQNQVGFQCLLNKQSANWMHKYIKVVGGGGLR